MIKVLQIVEVDRAEGFCNMYFLTECSLFLLDSAAASQIIALVSRAISADMLLRHD